MATTTICSRPLLQAHHLASRPLEPSPLCRHRPLAQDRSLPPAEARSLHRHRPRLLEAPTHLACQPRHGQAPLRDGRARRRDWWRTDRVPRQRVLHKAPRPRWLLRALDRCRWVVHRVPRTCGSRPSTPSPREGLHRTHMVLHRAPRRRMLLLDSRPRTTSTSQACLAPGMVALRREQARGSPRLSRS